MKEINETSNPDTELPPESESGDLKKENIVALLRQSVRSFSGPLPSPETLKEYNAILPNAAERIFKMAEKTQDHYQSTREQLVAFEIKKVARGQILAFSIAITGMVGAVVCGFIGQATIGSIIGGATLISVVPHFFPGKRNKKEDDAPQQNQEQALPGTDEKESN